MRDGSPYPDGMELAGNHHMGGTRMGADPSISVVDADCKVHGMDNLFVGGIVGLRHRRPVHADDDDHRAGLRLGDHLSRVVVVLNSGLRSVTWPADKRIEVGAVAVHRAPRACADRDHPRQEQVADEQRKAAGRALLRADARWPVMAMFSEAEDRDAQQYGGDA